MSKINAKYNKDEKDEDIKTTEETKEESTVNEKITEEEATVNEEVDEEESTTAEESEESEKTDEEEDDFDYKYYGQDAVEETKSIAEKMFNDVVTTLKTRQSEWNKTFEEYKANKPPVDLFEYEENLIVKLDIPRASKDDVSIKMSTDSLEIEIDFPDYLEDDEDVKVLRRERCFGKTKNIIPLPVEVDIKEVKASFDDNELTITLPKIKGRKVDVEIV